MFVKMCDVCGEEIHYDHCIQIDSGIVTFDADNDIYFNFADVHICMSCARTFNLMQILNAIDKRQERDYVY